MSTKRQRSRPGSEWQAALNEKLEAEVRAVVGSGTRAADVLQTLVAAGCDLLVLGYQLSEIRSANGRPAITPKRMAKHARDARIVAALMRTLNYESDPRVSPLALLLVRMREIADKQASRKTKRSTTRERSEIDRLSQLHDSFLHAPELIEKWANMVGAREDGSVEVPMTGGVREGAWIRYGPSGELAPDDHRLWVPAAASQSRKVFVADARKRGLPDELAALETKLVDYVKRKTAVEHYRHVAVLLLAFKRGLRSSSESQVRKEASRLKQQTKRLRDSQRR